MQNKPKTPQLLRWDDAMELLSSVDDPITNQLLNLANFEVLRRFFKVKEFPDCDFDLRFFLEVMRVICSDHVTLRKILAGEDLRVFSTDDFQRE